VKIRFTARAIPETSAKESLLKITLLGLLCTLNRDFSWTNDLSIFFKAPPEVTGDLSYDHNTIWLMSILEAFDNVVPSERTRLSVKVQDSALRVVGVDRPVSLVLHVGELGLLTDLVDSSSDSSMSLDLPRLRVLLTEDHTAGQDINTRPIDSSSETPDGLALWKVISLSRYSLLGLDLRSPRPADTRRLRRWIP
jgi:autophagy-related protein 2